jgi:hypothetical protein
LKLSKKPSATPGWAAEADYEADLIPMNDPDLMSLNGAEQLAAEIMRYWLERGHKIEATVVPYGAEDADGGDKIWSVRTNLLHGMPR